MYCVLKISSSVAASVGSAVAGVQVYVEVKIYAPTVIPNQEKERRFFNVLGWFAGARSAAPRGARRAGGEWLGAETQQRLREGIPRRWVCLPALFKSALLPL